MLEEKRESERNIFEKKGRGSVTHVAERDIAIVEDEALIGWLATQCVLARGQQTTEQAALSNGIAGYALQSIPESRVVEIIFWDAAPSSCCIVVWVTGYVGAFYALSLDETDQGKRHHKAER